MLLPRSTTCAPVKVGQLANGLRCALSSRSFGAPPALEISAIFWFSWATVVRQFVDLIGHARQVAVDVLVLRVQLTGNRVEASAQGLRIAEQQLPRSIVTGLALTFCTEAKNLVSAPVRPVSLSDSNLSSGVT